MTKKTEEKKTPARDAFGRFKAKLAAKANEIKAKAKVKKTEKAEVKPKTFSLKNLSKLTPRGAINAYIKLDSKNVPAGKTRTGGVATTAFTSTSVHLFVTYVQDYGNGACYVQYTPLDGQPAYRYFPSDLQVSYLTGDEKVEIEAKWAKHRLANLHQNLHHHWMIGSDPEIFVKNGKDQMIPAFLFMGSKEKPNKTPGGQKFGGHGGKPMYWDGFQAEFTTEANNCLGWHMDSIAAGMRGVYDQARKRFPDAQLSLQSVYDIDPEILETAADEHVEFGCMPSINAYGLKADMPPARQVGFRSAGGHIHFGIGKTSEKAALPIVKALDAILGVSCVSLFGKYDDPKRRVLYGLPGEFRLPKHGLEYRPLSNAWLCHPMIANLVIDISRKCVMFGKNGYFPDAWDATEEETIETIIRCDVDKAREIMKRNKDILCKLYRAAYPWAGKEEQELIFNIFMQGLESVVKDPNDFETNWTLKGEWIGHSGGIDKNVNHALRNLLSQRAAKKKHLV